VKSRVLKLIRNITATVSAVKQRLSSNAVSGVSHSRKLAGSPVRAVKRVKFEPRPGQVVFISDRLSKFLVENDRMETYLIPNNYEKNLLFHHGAGARDVYQNSLDKLQGWSTSSVDKVIACFGTKDIINTQYKNTDVTYVIREISYAVT